jgi:hypothetical protein
MTPQLVDGIIKVHTGELPCNTIILVSILTMGQMYGEREEYCCLKETQAALINIRIDQLY